MGKATFRAFRAGPVEFEFQEGVDAVGLKEAMSDLDLRVEGSAVWINGTRIAGSDIASAQVKPGDDVRIAPKSDQG